MAMDTLSLIQSIFQDTQENSFDEGTKMKLIELDNRMTHINLGRSLPIFFFLSSENPTQSSIDGLRRELIRLHDDFCPNMDFIPPIRKDGRKKSIREMPSRPLNLRKPRPNTIDSKIFNNYILDKIKQQAYEFTDLVRIVTEELNPDNTREWIKFRNNIRIKLTCLINILWGVGIIEKIKISNRRTVILNRSKFLTHFNRKTNKMIEMSNHFIGLSNLIQRNRVQENTPEFIKLPFALISGNINHFKIPSIVNTDFETMVIKSSKKIKIRKERDIIELMSSTFFD